MANTKSALKNHRKTIARKSRLKTLAKKVKALAEQKDREALKIAAVEYVSAMDRASKRNLIHRNKASRAKASVAKLLAA
jgi:small subunit ribosomal protein S20